MENKIYFRNGLLGVRLKGTSMGPFVRDGDMVIIKKITSDKIRVGDIILYRIGEDFFAHRVLKRIANNLFALKADAVTGIDRNVRVEEVIGKVVCIARGNRAANLQSSKWYIMNYFVLVYSFGLSILRDVLRVVRSK
jgi:signal peptidase I